LLSSSQHCNSAADAHTQSASNKNNVHVLCLFTTYQELAIEVAVVVTQMEKVEEAGWTQKGRLMTAADKCEGVDGTILEPEVDERATDSTKELLPTLPLQWLTEIDSIHPHNATKIKFSK